jgi:hypothetical protein
MPIETDLGAQLGALLGQVLSNDIVQAGLKGALVALSVLWLASTWWAFRDAAIRTGNTMASFGVLAMVALGGPLLFPLVLLAYLLVRPGETVAEREERSLSLQALEGSIDRGRCPTCEQATLDGWLRCPWCATWLLVDCDRCGRAVEPGWEICPFCAIERSPGRARGRVPGRRIAQPAGGRIPRPDVPAPVALVQREAAEPQTALQRAAEMLRVAARSSGTPGATRTTGER